MLDLKVILVFFILFQCCDKEVEKEEAMNMDCESEMVDNATEGCDGKVYPDLSDTEYVLPYPPGKSYSTGLTNCSASFHSAGRGDAYAFDFDMPNNSNFHAIRAGEVVKVVESHPNSGDGTAGNYLVIDHGDDTYGLYYHSPPDGIYVEVGETVSQGQLLGLSGTSGYAGYPHLHLIVVKDKHEWPYEGVPISFKNAVPRHLVLKSYEPSYTACEYE